MKKVIYYIAMTYKNDVWKNIGIAVLMFVSAVYGDYIMEPIFGDSSMNVYYWIFFGAVGNTTKKGSISNKNDLQFADSRQLKFAFRIIELNQYSLMALFMCMLSLFARDVDFYEYIIRLSAYFLLALNFIAIAEINRNMKYLDRFKRWTINNYAKTFLYILILLLLFVATIVLLIKVFVLFGISKYITLYILMLIATFFIHKFQYRSYFERKNSEVPFVSMEFI